MRPRTAWRHALGWAQWKLAQEYNTVHSGAKLPESRISEYESWPYGGRPPSMRYLGNLAIVLGHGCTPSQLVDADDLAQLTPADRCLLTQSPNGHSLTAITAAVSAAPSLAMPHTQAGHDRFPGRRSTPMTAVPAAQGGSELVLPTDFSVWAAVTGLQIPDDFAMLLMKYLGSLTLPDRDILTMLRERDHNFEQLVQFLTTWADTMNRREVLRTLGWAATAAALFHDLDPEEQKRVASVLNNPSRIDAQVIEHIDAVLRRCELQDDTLGPRAVLDTVLAQRNLIRGLLPECPEPLRSQLLSVLSYASREAGWLSFDLNDFTSAAYYYDDARTLAHEAENIELGATVLGNMSLLAYWQGKSRIGIDHAVAASQWAGHTGDMRLRGHCADKAAQAYAAAGRRDACLAELDAAQAALAAISDQATGYVYAYDEGQHISNRGKCHLLLHDAERAAGYAQQSLAVLDQSYTRIVALTTVDLVRAYTQSHEIDEAARLLGDAGEIAARNSSARLLKAVQQSRAELAPWQNSSAVRELDDRLTTCGVT